MLDVQMTLLPYQIKWLSDKNPLRIWEKSRRIGASYTLALEAVLAGMGEDGTNTYYLSYNKDMTRQFIKDAAYWCGVLQVAVDVLEEKIVTDDRKDITVFRIKFASGKEIAALPSVEYSIRSKQGDVILDEAAFVEDFEGIKKAALALLIWGGRFSVLSTHFGADNPFNLFIKKIERGEEKKWTIHRTTFDQAIEQGLYKKICEKQGIKWTREKEKKFVLEVYEVYKDNADEELRCVPTRSGLRYLPRLLLEQCIDLNIFIARKSFEDTFLHERKEKKEKVITKFFDAEIYPYILDIETDTYLGFDFGRSGDLSVIWVAVKSGYSLLSSIIIELRNCPFEAQYLLLELIINNLKNLKASKGDARGNGQMIAEKLAVEHPIIFDPVMISNAWYARVMPALKAAIEEKNFTVPADDYILGDFGTVQLIQGVPKIAERTAESGTRFKRHGDSAIAAAMCYDAFLSDGEVSSPYVVEIHRKNDNMLADW